MKFFLYLQILILKSPQKHKMSINKIITFLDQNDYEQAYDILKKLLNKDPENTDLLTLKGYILFKLGDIEKAKTVLRNVIIKKPADSEAWKYFAEIYLEEDQYEKAFRAYKISYRDRRAKYVQNRIFVLALFLYEFEEIKKYMKSEHYELINNLSIIANKASTLKNIENMHYMLNDLKSIEIVWDKKFLGPLYRAEFVRYIYSLIIDERYDETFELLRQYFKCATIQAVIMHIICYEWIEFIYLLLEKLYMKNYCISALKLVNTLIFIFNKYKKAELTCLMYLFDEKRYDDIFYLIKGNLEKNIIFHQTVKIKNEIIKKHPDYNLKGTACNCSTPNKTFECFQYFYIDIDNLKNEVI